MSLTRSESNGSQLRRSDSAASHRNLLPEPGEARESGVALQGSSLTFYNRTLDNNPDWPGVKNYFASISAQRAYRKHSVEELRAIDYARAGSARAKYSRTHDLAANPPLAFLAISAMPAYADVCQEEIRLADYWYHPAESGIATFNELLSFGRAPPPREVSADDPFPPAWSDPDKVKEDGFAVVPPEGVSGFEFIAPPMPPTLGALVEPSSPNESSPKGHVVDKDDVEESTEEPTSILKQLQEMMRQAQQIKKGDEKSRMQHLRETAAMFNRTLGLTVPSEDCPKDDDVSETVGVESIERRYDDRSRVDDESDEDERRKSFRESTSQFPSVLQLPDSPSSANSGVADAADIPLSSIALPESANDPFTTGEESGTRASPFHDGGLSAQSIPKAELNTNFSAAVGESESDSDTIELDRVSNTGSMPRPRPFVPPKNDGGVSDGTSDGVQESNDAKLNLLTEEKLGDRILNTTGAIPKVESKGGPFDLAKSGSRQTESAPPINKDGMDVRRPGDDREEAKHESMKRMDSFLEDAAAVARVEPKSERLVRTSSIKPNVKRFTSKQSSKKPAHSVPMDAPHLPVMPVVSSGPGSARKSQAPGSSVTNDPERNLPEVSVMSSEPSAEYKESEKTQDTVVKDSSNIVTKKSLTLPVSPTKDRHVVPAVMSPMDAPDLPKMPDTELDELTVDDKDPLGTARISSAPSPLPAVESALSSAPLIDSSAPAQAVHEASLNKFVTDRPRAPTASMSRFNIGATETKRSVVRSGSRVGIDRSASAKSLRSSNALRKTSSISGISRSSSRSNISISSNNDSVPEGPKKKPKRSRNELETAQTTESIPFADSKAFSVSSFSNKPFVFANEDLEKTKSQFVPASASSDELPSKLSSNPFEQQPGGSTAFEEAGSKPSSSIATPSTSYDDFASRAAAAMLGSKSPSPFDRSEGAPAATSVFGPYNTPFENTKNAPTTSVDSSNANTSFDNRVKAFDSETQSKTSSFDSHMNGFDKSRSEQPASVKSASSFGANSETRNTVASVVPEVPPSFPKFQDGASSDLFKSLELKPAPSGMLDSHPSSVPRAKSFPASKIMDDSTPEFPTVTQKRPMSMNIENEQSSNMFKSAFQLFERRTTMESDAGMDVAPAVLPPAPFAKRKAETKKDSRNFGNLKKSFAVKAEAKAERNLLKKKEAAREFALPAKKREPASRDAFGGVTDFAAVKRALGRKSSSPDAPSKPVSPTPMSASNSEGSIEKKNSRAAGVPEIESTSENSNVFDMWRKKIDNVDSPMDADPSIKPDARIQSPVDVAPESLSSVETKKEKDDAPSYIKKWTSSNGAALSKEELGSTASESPTSSGKSAAKDAVLPMLARPTSPSPALQSETERNPQVENQEDHSQPIRSGEGNGNESRHVQFRDLESVAIADHGTSVDGSGLDTIQKPAPLPPYGNDALGIEASDGSDSDLSGSAEYQDCIDTVPSNKSRDGFWSKTFSSAKSRAEAAEDEIVSHEKNEKTFFDYSDPTQVENVDGPSISDSIARRMQLFQASAAAKPNVAEEKSRPRSVLLPKPPAVIPDPGLDDAAAKRNTGVLKNISGRFFGQKKVEIEPPQEPAKASTQIEKKPASRKTVPKPVAGSSRTSTRDAVPNKPSQPKPSGKSSSRPKPPSTSPPPPPPPPPTFLRAGTMGEKKEKPPKAATFTNATPGDGSKVTVYHEKLDGTKRASSAVRKSSSAHSATAVKSKSRTRNTTGNSSRIRARKSEEVRKHSVPIEKISIPTSMGDVECDSPKSKSFGHLDNVNLPKRSKSKSRNARARDVELVGSNSTRRRDQKPGSERAQKSAEEPKSDTTSVPSKSKSSKVKTGSTRNSLRTSKDSAGAGPSGTSKRKPVVKKQLRDGQNDVKRSAKHQGPKSGRRKTRPNVKVAASRSISDFGRKSKRMDSNTETISSARAHSDIFSVPPARAGSTLKDEYDNERDASSLAIMQTPEATRQMSLTRRHSLPSRASTDGAGHSSLLPSANRSRKGQPRTHTMLAALWGQGGTGRDDNSFHNLKTRRASTDLDEERVKRLRQKHDGGADDDYSDDRGGLIANVRRLFSRRVRRKDRERAGVLNEGERASIAGIPEQREPRGSITRGSLGGMRGSTQRGSTGMRGSLNSTRTSSAVGRREARRAKSEHKNSKRRGVLFKSQ